MKTLKLKKDVVEQLSSNEAQHAMGGVPTVAATKLNCPTVMETECKDSCRPAVTQCNCVPSAPPYCQIN